MVDLGGYVIILVETKDKKIKLYGKIPNLILEQNVSVINKTTIPFFKLVNGTAPRKMYFTSECDFIVCWKGVVKTGYFNENTKRI